MSLPSLLSFLAFLLIINAARAKPDNSSSSFSSSSSSFSFSSSSISASSSPFSSSPSPSVTSSNTLSASTGTSSHATTSSKRSLSLTTTWTTTESYSSSTALSNYPILSSYATSSSVPPTFVVANATLVVTTSDAASVVVVTLPTASTPHDLSSSGFWSNKGIVAATFSIVALFLCGLIGGAIFVLARQHKRDRELNVAEEFLDKHNSLSLDVIHGPSPSPSMTRETVHASAEEYMSRDIHFGSYYGGQETYGLDYPPGTAINQDNGQPIHFNYSSDNRGHSSAYVPPSVAVGNTPPVSHRQSRGRESGTYQPSSVDSFYGGIQNK